MRLADWEIFARTNRSDIRVIPLATLLKGKAAKAVGDCSTIRQEREGCPAPGHELEGCTTKRHNNILRGLLPAILAVVFFLGVMGTAQAVSAASPVGVVDYLYLINQHPDTPKANEALRSEQEQARKEFAEKAAGLSEKEKQELGRQLDQRVEQKRQELLRPITENINAAMKAVADAKGLTIVVHKNSVALGGADITAEVLNKITGR